MTLLSYQQVAEMLNVSKRSVQRLVVDGSLPVVWVTRQNPRIDVADVERLVAERRRVAVASGASPSPSGRLLPRRPRRVSAFRESLRAET